MTIADKSILHLFETGPDDEPILRFVPMGEFKVATQITVASPLDMHTRFLGRGSQSVKPTFSYAAEVNGKCLPTRPYTLCKFQSRVTGALGRSLLLSSSCPAV